jgi:glycosyltransferase involved in cell wall biosynthesis
MARIMAPDLSVLIPTFGRPRKAAACVAALARQTLDRHTYEVLVGLDGADPDTEVAVGEAWGDCPPEGLRVVPGERAGTGPTRNRLLEVCRGGTLLVVNDDIRPEPEFLGVHLREQRCAADAGRPAVIAGHSPWIRPEEETGDTLFDRLVRETSMVFFYDRMNGADPHRDWGFRHAWGLNVSMPTEAAVAVGGWAPILHEYGHDDLELAWRLRRHRNLPVLFRPQARAPHDHRLSPRGYLVREFLLGRSAWAYAKRNPDFGRDLFGRDITAPEELDYSRAYVQRERAAAARLYESFTGLADLPASSLNGPHAGALVNQVYEQHLPLKRWMWRAGQLAVAEGRPMDEIAWPDA